MFRRVCPKCKREGSVHGERVVKGDASHTVLRCDACAFTWREPDAAARRPRSRSSRRKAR